MMIFLEAHRLAAKAVAGRLRKIHGVVITFSPYSNTKSKNESEKIINGKSRHHLSPPLSLGWLYFSIAPDKSERIVTIPPKIQDVNAALKIAEYKIT